MRPPAPEAATVHPRHTTATDGTTATPARAPATRASLVRQDPALTQELRVPQHRDPGPSADDVNDAIRVAREVNDAAAKILKSEILSPW
jgi:hypothetical protein